MIVFLIFSFAMSMAKSSLAGRCMLMWAEVMKPTVSLSPFVYFASLKPSASSLGAITRSLTVLSFLPALGVEVNLGKGHNAISLGYI